MDQPATKKRRLAPKVEPQPSPSHYPPQPAQSVAASPAVSNATSYAHEPAPPVQHYPAPEAPRPVAERNEFESFARHLQDAAMLIQRQSQKPSYENVSVLLLSWEDDNAAEQDILALEQVFRERYKYRTEKYTIPAVPNASVKLGVRVASFLEPAGPDTLLIVHYAGYAFVGSDKQMYWASNPGKNVPRLRWDGFRCLIEESSSDVLLLLDSCSVKGSPVTLGNSTKQVIAASNPEHYARDSVAKSFTANLAEAFLQLSGGKPFTSELLYQEAARLRHHELLQVPGITNGMSTKATLMLDKLPLLYNINSGKAQSLSLCPLVQAAPPQSQHPELNLLQSREMGALHPSALAELAFEDPRVLVCTTFVGEATPDLSSFYHWLQNAPSAGPRIAVEGMFLGPPTMLLISMPSAVWNVVEHDKVCCFLGHINSHNMTHLYKELIGSMPLNPALARDMDDGRMLLEPREVPKTTPVTTRRHVLPETPRTEGRNRVNSMTLSQTSSVQGMPYSINTPGTAISRKADVEDSAEMQEAAEQLKALSHMRHVSDDVSSARPQHSPSIRADPKMEERSMVDVNDKGTIELYYTDQTTPSSRSKQGRRRSIQKPIVKQETRCGHCSHAPFKDSSSLRKHIAAAHTRPFPCAFAFAGCPSTFGSKNEWKRHIASQHLCLQYYRCSACPQSSVEGKGNEFNRKDLFTQHLRRMHAPFAIKKSISKSDGKLQADWEDHVKSMQQSCLVTRRKPPQRSACPKPGCTSTFEGPTSWDEWTEHVGRHMEKGEAGIGVDRLLSKWALDEGIIERKEDGEYRLCSGAGSGSEKDHANDSMNHKSNNTEYHEDSNKRDLEERTIVAASTIVDKMDMD
ncbi:hypothetical protein GGR57DRAFT_393998 [Xylariaceae sp. FL1272]|nr:hypothetical protein GGR57DRAFT_393998 [Xylariaceae sp. FL1272]